MAAQYKVGRQNNNQDTLFPPLSLSIACEKFISFLYNPKRNSRLCTVRRVVHFVRWEETSFSFLESHCRQCAGLS